MRALLSLLILAGCAREPCRCRDAQGVWRGPPEEEAHEEATSGGEAPRPSAPSEETPSRENALDAEWASAEAIETLRGQVSYYHDSLAGNGTANGDIYDPEQFTAAHRTLPFGTIVRVVRIENGRTVVVRINDRGPFGRRRRLMDLSRAAAEQLGMIRAGVTEARVEVLRVPE